MQKISFIRSKKIFLFIVFVSLIGIPRSAFARPLNYIISDRDLTDISSFSVAGLQSFLAAKGALGSMTFEMDGIQSTPAQIIDRYAREYRISQKYLVTRIQVEQALITDLDPSQYQLDWATGYGRCDNCSPEQAAEYRGFVNQVRWAAKRVRESYLADLEAGRPTISGWQKGTTKLTLDGISVTPQNNATAVLYTYTPWAGKLFGGDTSVGGNGLFHKIFTEWFGIRYTDGTLLQDTDNGGIYLLKNGKKLPFVSRAAFFANYDIKKVIPASRAILDAYPTGTPIKFPDFTLLRSPKGTVYLYQQGSVRGIESQEVLGNLGFNPEEIIDITWSDLHSFTEGPHITLTDVFPAGVLLQYRETGGVVYVDPQGVRHPIVSREILQSRFPGRTIILKSREEIHQHKLGDKVLFRDGELVTARDRATVYVISHGQKHPFRSGEVFQQFGYRWDNIIFTTPEALDLHPTGAPIRIEQ